MSINHFFYTMLAGNPASGSPPSSEFTNVISYKLRGQSNALGRASVVDLSEADAAPQDGIYMFMNNGIEKYKAGNFYLNPGQYGVELFLSQKLRDYHNKPVYIDKTAWGGTKLANDPSVSDWNLHTGELWNSANLRSDSFLFYALSYRFSVQDKFMLWFQGESDSVLESDSLVYEQNEIEIFADMRARMADPNYKIVDVLTSINYGSYAANVRAGKLNISAVDQNVINLDSDNYDKFDGTHLSQQGLRDLAEDTFQIVKDFWVF